MSKDSILLTGVTGFVGANLARELIKDDRYEVHAILRRDSNRWRVKGILGKLVVHEADLRDFKALSPVVDEISPEYVFHLAAFGGYPTIQVDVHEIAKTNFLGTVNLVKACEDIPYKCFVNAGSSSEYGLKNHPISETDLLEPVSAYGVSKAASTLFCQMTAKASGKPITTLRMFSVYGYYEEPVRIVPTAIKHCLEGTDLRLTSGNQPRDLVFIEDAVQAFIKAIKVQSVGGQVFNVGSGIQHTVRVVVEKIRGLTNSETRLLWSEKPMRSFEPECWVADVKKSVKVLGWKPKNNLEQGLRKTISWFKENKKLYD